MRPYFDTRTEGAVHPAPRGYFYKTFALCLVQIAFHMNLALNFIHSVVFRLIAAEFLQIPPIMA